MLDRARGRPVKPVDADPWLTESALVRAQLSTAHMPSTADAAGHEIIWPNRKPRRSSLPCLPWMSPLTSAADPNQCSSPRLDTEIDCCMR